MAERCKEGAQRVKEITDGVGADAVLECVGTDGAMKQAFACARPGSTVGFVGVPHGVDLPVSRMFQKNVGLAGGMAPVRRYLPELLELVTSGTVDPGLVFDTAFLIDEKGNDLAGYKNGKANGTSSQSFFGPSLQALTRTLALEYADRNIRVNSIGPGATITPINQAWIEDPAKKEQVESHIPLRRAGTADEMAGVTCFLASDDAAYITGQTVFVDGGLTLFADFREPWSSE